MPGLLGRFNQIETIEEISRTLWCQVFFFNFPCFSYSTKMALCQNNVIVLMHREDRIRLEGSWISSSSQREQWPDSWQVASDKNIKTVLDGIQLFVLSIANRGRRLGEDSQLLFCKSILFSANLQICWTTHGAMMPRLVFELLNIIRIFDIETQYSTLVNRDT